MPGGIEVNSDCFPRLTKPTTDENKNLGNNFP